MKSCRNDDKGNEQTALEDEMIISTAAEILEKHKAAFIELAK